jgi:hypothetical protein
VPRRPIKAGNRQDRTRSRCSVVVLVGQHHVSGTQAAGAQGGPDCQSWRARVCWMYTSSQLISMSARGGRCSTGAEHGGVAPRAGTRLARGWRALSAIASISVAVLSGPVSARRWTCGCQGRYMRFRNSIIVDAAPGCRAGAASSTPLQVWEAALCRCPSALT